MKESNMNITDTDLDGFDEMCPFCRVDIGRELETMWAKHDHKEDFSFDCPYCDNTILTTVMTVFRVVKGAYSTLQIEVVDKFEPPF